MATTGQTRCLVHSNGGFCCNCDARPPFALSWCLMLRAQHHVERVLLRETVHVQQRVLLGHCGGNSSAQGKVALSLRMATA